MATNALGPWFILGTNQQTSESTLFQDSTATNDDMRIYRAKPVP